MKRKAFLLCALAVTLTVIGTLIAGCDSEEPPPSNDGNTPTETTESTQPNDNITVTYYVSEADPKPISVRVTDGVLTLSELPTRENYQFNGLFDAPTGGAMYLDSHGRCLVAIEKSVILYAQWTGNPHTIFFDPTGGALAAEQAQMSLGYGDTLTTLPVPAQTGHTFLGWADAEGNMVSSGANVLPEKQTFTAENYKIENASTTLHAVFEVSKLTVTFHYNDGSYQIQEAIVEYGKPIAEEQYPQKTIEGKMLVGWAPVSNGTENFEGAITEDVNLYAIWKPYKTFTLNDTCGNLYEVLVYSDAPLILADYDKVIRPGYQIDGWYTTAHYAGNPVTEITYGSGYTTYYAKWSVATYNLSFVSTIGSVEIPSIFYNMGDTTELPILTQDGFVFDGWCTKEDCSDEVLRTIPATLYGDLTLYAKFTPNTYSVTMQPNGGALADTPTATVNYMTPYTLPVPTRVGYNFLGWYSGTETTALAYTDAEGKSLLAYHVVGDAEFYARWEIRKYTVTFETDGGTAVASQTYEHGSKLTLPAEPTKEGVIFDTWRDQELSKIYSSSHRVTEDITLYAKWIESTPISTAEELKAISSNCSGNYHLVANINLNGEAWTVLSEFSGNLNGKGHKIYNFTLNSTGIRSGLFGVNKGTIQNLTLADFSFTISDTNLETAHHGVIAGMNYGVIRNCHILDGVITDNKIAKYTGSYDTTVTYSSGGIAGYNNATIESCTVDLEFHHTENVQSTYRYTVDLTGLMYTGGIAGENEGKILNCSAMVNATYYISAARETSGGSRSVTIAYLYGGGLVGINNPNGYIEFSEAFVNLSATANSNSNSNQEPRLGGAIGLNRGSVENCYAEGTIASGNYFEAVRLGGFICDNEAGSISNCYAGVDMTMTSGGLSLGGFVSINRAKISNCYSIGSMTSSVTVDIGSFVGANTETGSINKCFSTGNITAASKTKTGYFVGNPLSGSATYKCYYNVDMAVTIGGESGTPATTSGATGETLEILSDDNTIFSILGWDTSLWMTREGQLPVLFWKNDAPAS